MRGVLGLYTLDPNADDTSTRNVLRQSLHLIAKFPMLAVYAYQAYLDKFHGRSLVIHRPEPGLSTAENFLHMLRPDSSFTELEALVLDMTLVLHAEHGGGNNSTFTTHVVSSTGTDTYSAISASLGSLKGPRHGGANLKVVGMFDDLKTITDWEDDQQAVRVPPTPCSRQAGLRPVGPDLRHGAPRLLRLRPARGHPAQLRGEAGRGQGLLRGVRASHPRRADRAPGPLRAAQAVQGK